MIFLNSKKLSQIASQILQNTIKQQLGCYKSQAQFSDKFNPYDQEQAQKKMQEILKQYQNQDVQRTIVNEQQIKEKLKNRETKLPIQNFQIAKDGQFYNPKSNVNPTIDVFNFSEEFLKKKQQVSQVYGLGNGYFSVNQVWYPGSVMIFPQQIFLWDVQTASDIRAHSLDFLEVVKPAPSYIIIGTGKEKFFLEESIYDRFTKQKIRVDILPTFEACSTFNVCAEDGMNVCALLIPANL
ncbi:Hypothetical protein TTHERM_01298570 (macronuclear) [Tetrahymena thermophila SB210]|uniref:NADH dehydrogenase [ubiquinone] 1 alpha subcomplex assembly factor 3 n=1 Tax=Tetrahymena thermophila (strain SB210) TaxID=312017 RepID=Q22A08_TETTS|nr:Hypothetical protein TTHERM_01298570 [Tetrahymena thermophila SB210]EAR82134.2 Hypothetical protein TTHERM_01298570 [Tetrahymena thermophila SB210]|eukprot:XP_001029797.2 Hypothetical protein TTHERM_01298570 [Tetrahymena thermophila SB210]